MKILLDENFPLALVQKLRERAHEVDHIILLGLRGTPDSAIIERLRSGQVLFLSCDLDFLELSLTSSAVIVSRVTQSLPLEVRLERWLNAIEEYFAREWKERLFEVFDNGRLVPWQVSSEQ